MSCAVCVPRKGRKYAEEFMAENVLLVPVSEDMAAGMPAFLAFLEKWRGIAGTVRLCLYCFQILLFAQSS